MLEVFVVSVRPQVTPPPPPPQLHGINISSLQITTGCDTLTAYNRPPTLLHLWMIHRRSQVRPTADSSFPPTKC